MPSLVRQGERPPGNEVGYLLVETRNALSLISNIPLAEVVQIPSSVGKLGRLEPRLVIAIIRKRRVAQPVRFNLIDVALGFVTL